MTENKIKLAIFRLAMAPGLVVLLVIRILISISPKRLRWNWTKKEKGKKERVVIRLRF